jgi:hypothetical protein
MSYNIEGALLTEFTKLTDGTATEVFPKSGNIAGQTLIASIVCTENNAGTPTLTIEAHDGTNSYYIRKAVAMTAGTAFVFDTPFVLPQAWTLKVTSSDAQGEIDVAVTYVAAVAAARLRL